VGGNSNGEPRSGGSRSAKREDERIKVGGERGGEKGGEGRRG